MRLLAMLVASVTGTLLKQNGNSQARIVNEELAEIGLQTQRPSGSWRENDYPVRKPGKCTPDSHCWPKEEEWQAFNTTIDGRLIRVEPLQAPCFEDPESSRCMDFFENKHNAYYYEDQPGAMMYPFTACTRATAECCWYTGKEDEQCGQGDLPSLAVDANSAEIVKKSVKFAADNNIPLSVKSTGHDQTGRSTSADTLNIWVHHMKGVKYVENWNSGCEGS